MTVKTLKDKKGNSWQLEFDGSHWSLWAPPHMKSTKGTAWDFESAENQATAEIAAQTAPYGEGGS